jgi:hypothetical protein
VTTYYVHVGNEMRELGETELCALQEYVPGTEFASEVGRAVGAGGNQHIHVADRADERAKLADACERCVRWRPSAIYAPTLLELQALLDDRS